MAQDQEAVASHPSAQPTDSNNDPLAIKDEDAPEDRDGTASDTSADEQMAASKNRDPDRPKRRKARRACAACQRAHLTCSDNRPCERCLKRNIADHCHDGVRKRPKYIHDAPAEALIPGHGPTPTFAPLTGFHLHNGQTQPRLDLTQADGYTAAHPSPSPSGYQAFTQNGDHSNMPPPPVVDTQIIPIARNRHSPSSSAFSSSTQPSPIQQYGQAQGAMSTQPSMNSQFQNVNDPNLYNFDLSQMNFGNHYGAMEFGMLEHMTAPTQQSAIGSGAQGGTTGYAQPAYTSTQYNAQDLAINPNNAWATTSANEMQGVRHSLDPSYDDQQWPCTSSTIPPAFTIRNGSSGSSFTGSSPGSTGDFMANGDNGSPVKNHTNTQQSHTTVQKQHQLSKQGQTTTLQKKPKDKSSPIKASSPPRPNPTAIYQTIKHPYPYTEAFHRLFGQIRGRFNMKKLARIAQAFCKIRPSFLSSTLTLVREDLVFMEQIFQRSLLEYQSYLDKLGTPTIVCRRTGEVAQTTQAFQMLAGWTSDVLLGQTPNLNINTDSSKSLDSSATSTVPTATAKGGFNTPTAPRTPTEPGDGVRPVEAQVKRNSKRAQPVFLAELLDEESVIRFYEDFARLAFADSKGSAEGRCDLLRYKTAEDESGQSSGKPKRKKPVVKMENGCSKVESQDGMKKLGAADGKVSCMYCWVVKRDVFNIPSLIVINFLPILF